LVGDVQVEVAVGLVDEQGERLGVLAGRVPQG